MMRPIARFRRLPFGGGPNVLLLGGAVYFAWEHEQGRHAHPHILCPICWLNKIAPPPEAQSDPSPAEPPGETET
jgi:hypothetical protein